MGDLVQYDAVVVPFRDSDQLSLGLDDHRVSVPWEGRNIRGLTRGARLVIFKTRVVKEHARYRDPLQLDLFARATTGPRECGAPLLLPLPWEVDDGQA